MAKSTTFYRSGSDGKFVTKKQGVSATGVTTKEAMPNPGRGDTRTAKSGRFLSQEPVTKRGNISSADALRAVETYRSGKK